MRRFNILFTSAGRRVALLRLFKKALVDLEVVGRIIVADCKKNAPSVFVADECELVPSVDHPGYVDALKDMCRRHDVTLVIPLIDTELLVLANHRDAFAQLGTTLLVSTPEVIHMCQDKRLTYDFFRRAGIATPELLDAGRTLANPNPKYPVLLKPVMGSGSAGVTTIRNARELAFFRDHVQDSMIQEFVTGQEYTLDILVDFLGQVRCVVPRLRIETRAGEVSKGMTNKAPAPIAAGMNLGEKLAGALGCITAQCFLTSDGVVTFFEVNPRFGGGFPLSAEAGANFPRWIIELLLGRHPEIVIDGWRDGLVMLRFDEAIFVSREMIQ